MSGLPTEEQWSLLLDEAELSKRRKNAEGQYRDLSSDQISFLRKKAKSDLFFLGAGPLGYDRLSPTFHGHYTNWLQKSWGERYRLTLFARDHFKSTVNTVADSVQMALPNDAGVQAHPYCLGTNLTMLIAHEIRDMASRFLFEITKAFMEKPLMLALFPECIPSRRIHRINKYELELPRTELRSAPTFDTIGAGGAAQGRHVNWIKLDDLIGEDARDSETVMKRILMWFDNINSLLMRLKIDGWDLTGTRWANSDIYAHAMKKYGIRKDKSIMNAMFKDDIDRISEGQLMVYARGAVENGKPVFPEEFSIEDLNILKRNPLVWAAQYANNPRESGLNEFQPHWLKFYNRSNGGKGDRISVFTGDKSWSVSIGDLDRVILVDPAVGENDLADEWGFVVTGMDKNKNIYVLEAFKALIRPPEGIQKLFDLYVKWNPRVMSIESVAFSAMIKYWFTERCQALGVYPSIYDYKPGSKKSKVGRIRGLAPYGAAGQLYCDESMHQLRDEWEWFPLGDSEHILDAFAQGPEIWMPGRESKDMEQNQKLAEDLMDHRSILTGY